MTTRQSFKSFNDLSQSHLWRFYRKLRHRRIMLVKITTAPKTAIRLKVSVMMVVFTILNANKKNRFSSTVITTSTCDLDQQKLYQRQTVRKLSTQLNNNNPLQQSVNSNTSSSSSSSGSSKYGGVSHSHSTGDMSAIFARAWRVSGNDTLIVLNGKTNGSLVKKKRKDHH